jgi:hypothetical protein
MRTFRQRNAALTKRRPNKFQTETLPDLKKPGFDRKPRSYFVIHLTAGIIGEADSILSMTGASLAPAKPVRRILDRADPLATIAAMR